ncbi:MAG: lycopene cyclase family protein [Balneolaceae bacterium]|nr:lycopene cyclase family protein [Balneolaceae bacterium]
MDTNNNYDYIIAGAGASGLSLAWHIGRSTLSDNKILVLDSDFSTSNEKTWCFWHEGNPEFNDLIFKSWSTAEVGVNGDVLSHELQQYPYHCIRSGDYREFILSELRDHPSFDFVESDIIAIQGNSNRPTLKTEDTTYSAEYIFQSCFIPPEFRSPDIKYPLVQSFLGYEIETDQSLFESNSFMLMDFDETYDTGLAFMYVLPWSDKSALVEYTLFDSRIRPKDFFEKKIEVYLNNKYNLKRIDYRVSRKEYGEIPMQDLPYVPWYAERVLNLGRSGGLTKPTTGYTFKRIQDHSKQIVEKLQHSGRPALPNRSSFRYRAYDLWLLHILHENPDDAYQIFETLFSKNEMDRIFKFLEEENSLLEDLKIMGSLPYLPFFKAIWKSGDRLFKV